MQEGSVPHALVYVGSLIVACAALHVVSVPPPYMVACSLARESTACHRSSLTAGGGGPAQVVPATVVTGYACDRQGRALVYRLNGLRVLFIVVLAFLGLVRSLIPLPGTTALFLTPSSVQSYVNVIDGEYLANNIWPCFHAGNIYGLLCSFIFYIKGIFLLPLVAASPSWHNAHLPLLPLLLLRQGSVCRPTSKTWDVGPSP